MPKIPLKREDKQTPEPDGRMDPGEEISAVYSSDLGRAHQTAQSIAEVTGIPVVADETGDVETDAEAAAEADQMEPVAETIQ